MSKNLMKLWPAAAATVVASTSFVQADTTSSSDVKPFATDQSGEQINPQMDASLAHPSARPGAKDGWNIFITADWLIWQANESGLGYALNNTGATSVNTPEEGTMGSGSVKNPHFDWEFGFRVGLGYNMPHDEWDMHLNWTWFHDKAHSSTTAGSGATDALFPTFMHPNAFDPFPAVAANSAHAHLKLHLNVLDLELGRQFYAGKWLSLRPHFGLRTAWVNQKYNVDYSTLFDVDSDVVLDSYSTDMKNDYWGIGVRGGLDTQWGLGAGFSIYGNAALSILYGFFDVHDTESYVDAVGVAGTLIAEKNSFRAGRAITDLQLGLRWDTNFSNERFHFGILAGWEHHMFFSQNQLMRFVDGDTVGMFIQNQGDLDFQGWTIAARFDF